MRNSIPVLRSITDKATGRTIRVLRPTGLIDRAWIEGELASVIDAQDGRPLGGYAIVVWGMDGRTTAAMIAGSMPRALVPQMVKDRLVLETAKQWIGPLVDSDEAG